MPGGFVGAGRIGSLGCALGAWVLLLLALCVVLWPWAGCVGVFTMFITNNHASLHLW